MPAKIFTRMRKPWLCLCCFHKTHSLSHSLTHSPTVVSSLELSLFVLPYCCCCGCVCVFLWAR
jgi:hypothetical protein